MEWRVGTKLKFIWDGSRRLKMCCRSRLEERKMEWRVGTKLELIWIKNAKNAKNADSEFHGQTNDPESGNQD